MGGGASTVKPTTVPERLAVNSFRVDEDESHIVVDQELCRTTGTAAAIIAVCPASVYSEQDGLIVVDHAALSLIHISEPTRLGMISYAVFCLNKKKKQPQ